MTSQWLDQPTPVREGEAFDTELIEIYLKANLPDLSGTLQVRQFPQGFSNLTYLLQLGEREFVLRRPPFGVNIKGAHDMRREYKILSQLYQTYPNVPKALLYCTNEAVLDVPFYVMERVQGIVLRNGMSLEARPSAEMMSRIADSFIDNFVALHNVDYETAGLGDLGKPTGYVERQIDGWAKRYQKAKTDDVPELDRTITWLTNNMPPDSGAALIHNDYKYNNLMLNPNNWAEIIAVLDWEMSTLGDPLMDLGTSLGYWIEPNDAPLMQHLKFSPTYWPGNPSRTTLVKRYAQQSGRDVSNIVFYYVYGLFKLAVIIQQIYRRYKLGYTKDKRFAQLDQEVKLCGQIANQTINKDRIDDLF